MPSVWDTPLGQARLREMQQEAEERQRAAKKRRSTRVVGGLSQRMYAAAKSSRLTGGWGTTNSSADAELVTSLTTIRSRSRMLVRDASYAKRAKTVVVNNVIGSGIGMQAQVKSTRGALNTRVNDEIEVEWERWAEADSCHTGGRLHFSSLERAGMGQVFEAGEVFFRKHYRPFGSSSVPFALELIEAERIADDYQAIGPAAPGNTIRMGIELDPFYRPVAYWIRERHPGEIRWAGESDRLIRVPADQMIHLAVVDRWPQTRGEPWLHAVTRRLMDMDGYSEAEIVRARSQAGVVGAIETADDVDTIGQPGEGEEGGSLPYEVSFEPGTFPRLNPGEKWHGVAPTSPNAAMDPFMRYMLREIAAGTGVSYESISRDYSQSNYSSSRLALLDDRDLWRVYQWWFIREFRHQVHREWLRQAIYSRTLRSFGLDEYASDMRKFEAVLFKPRGWSWIDPTKEVKAADEAVRKGFTTVSDVIAQTAGGQDIEDILATRKRELELMKEAGLVFETSPEFYMASVKQEEAAPPDEEPEEPDPPDEDETETDDAPPRAGRFVLGVVK